MLGLESLKEAQMSLCKTAALLQWSLWFDILEMPVWGDHQERQHQGNGTNLSLKHKLCVL